MNASMKNFVRCGRFQFDLDTFPDGDVTEGYMQAETDFGLHGEPMIVVLQDLSKEYHFWLTIDKLYVVGNPVGVVLHLHDEVKDLCFVSELPDEL